MLSRFAEAVDELKLFSPLQDGLFLVRDELSEVFLCRDEGLHLLLREGSADHGEFLEGSDARGVDHVVVTVHLHGEQQLNQEGGANQVDCGVLLIFIVKIFQFSQLTQHAIADPCQLP